MKMDTGFLQALTLMSAEQRSLYFEEIRFVERRRQCLKQLEIRDAEWHAKISACLKNWFLPIRECEYRPEAPDVGRILFATDTARVQQAYAVFKRVLDVELAKFGLRPERFYGGVKSPASIKAKIDSSRMGTFPLDLDDVIRFRVVFRRLVDVIGSQFT